MRPPSSGQLRKAGGRAKEARLSTSPDTRGKEQHVSVTSFFKNEVKKYWRFVNNKQSRHVSV